VYLEQMVPRVDKVLSESVAVLELLGLTEEKVNR
jgi:hypothetical protein